MASGVPGESSRQAFPCISTGVYGYPNGQAAETVLKAVREYLKEHRNS
ncbi:hypothetical protein scyTo_0017995, partial [Scyliorhinus torazame]|nr:hypothetical protein [Scyliorhinus torazame]